MALLDAVSPLPPEPISRLKPEYLYYVVPKAGLADEATIQRTWWVPAAN